MTTKIKKIFKQILHTYKYSTCKLRILFFLTLTSVTSVTFLMEAYIQKNILDSAISGGNYIKIIKLILISLCFYIILAAIQALKYYLGESINRNLEFNIKDGLYSKLVCTKLDTIREYRVEDIITRMTSDIDLISGSVTWVLSGSISVIISGGIALIYLAEQSIIISILTFAFGILALIISYKVARKLKAVNADLYDHKIQVEEQVIQYTCGKLTISVLKCSNWAISKFDIVRKRLMQINCKQASVSYMAGNSVFIIRRLLATLLTLYAVYLFIEGKGSLGLILAFKVIGDNAFFPFTRISSLFIEWQNYSVTYERVSEFIEKLNNRKEVGTISVKTNNEVVFSLNNIKYSIYGKNILEFDSLEIIQGSKVAIIGESGTGKSTLCRLLTGIYIPESGEVLFYGKPLDHWKCEQKYKLMNYIPQITFLHEETVIENIVPSNAVEKESSNSLIEDIDNYAEIKNLSQGQKQRVAIEACLTNNPEILVLDEPVAAIDTDGRKKFYDFINHYKGTVIMVTHILDELDWADYVIKIENKRPERCSKKVMNGGYEYYEKTCKPS